MENREVALKIMQLCKDVKNVEAVDTLFADDVVSIEAMPMPDGRREMKGLAQVREKNAAWVAMNDVHSVTVSGPWPSGNRFVIGFKFDTTNTLTGKRSQVEEMGLYEVRNGKVVREEFFYEL